MKCPITYQLITITFLLFSTLVNAQKNPSVFFQNRDISLDSEGKVKIIQNQQNYDYNLENSSGEKTVKSIGNKDLFFKVVPKGESGFSIFEQDTAFVSDATAFIDIRHTEIDGAKRVKIFTKCDTSYVDQVSIGEPKIIFDGVDPGCISVNSEICAYVKENQSAISEYAKIVDSCAGPMSRVRSKSFDGFGKGLKSLLDDKEYQKTSSESFATIKNEIGKNLGVEEKNVRTSLNYALNFNAEEQWIKTVSHAGRLGQLVEICKTVDKFSAPNKAPSKAKPSPTKAKKI